MAMIRGMMAASLDGYAADSEGGVGWLDRFNDVDWGWDAFIGSIQTVVMGRLTYLQATTLSSDWPYPGKRAIILGRGLVPPLQGLARAWDDGLDALIDHLRAIDDGDAWVVGGPSLQSAMIAKGAIDRLQICIVPQLLGQGVPLFPPSPLPPRQPRLTNVKSLGGGMVLLDYSFL